MHVGCATRRLLRASFDGAVTIYAVQFYQTPKPGLRMKIKFLMKAIYTGVKLHLLPSIAGDDYRTFD